LSLRGVSKLSEIKRDSVRGYLLGTLGEPERTEFEKQLLNDDALYDELLIHEDELTDEYISGGLAERERRSFENNFLSGPQGQEKLRFALGLQRYIGQANDAQRSRVAESQESASPIGRLAFFPKVVRRNPTAAYAVAAVLVFGFIAIAWIAFNNFNRRTAGTGETVVATLTPGSVRGEGQTDVVQIRPGVEFLQLQLLLPADEYKDYRAEIVGQNSSLHVATDLKAHTSQSGKFVAFKVPADVLRQDDYHVKLAGRVSDGEYEDVAGYFLRILK